MPASGQVNLHHRFNARRKLKITVSASQVFDKDGKTSITKRFGVAIINFCFAGKNILNFRVHRTSRHDRTHLLLMGRLNGWIHLPMGWVLKPPNVPGSGNRRPGRTADVSRSAYQQHFPASAPRESFSATIRDSEQTRFSITSSVYKSPPLMDPPAVPICCSGQPGGSRAWRTWFLGPYFQSKLFNRYHSFLPMKVAGSVSVKPLPLLVAKPEAYQW